MTAVLPAAQQPDWHGHPAFDHAVTTLAGLPPLVLPEELRVLRDGLAEVAAGHARVLQIGDCAESFYDSTADHTARRIAALDELAARFEGRVGQEVLRIGRVGGQYAKPRTQPVEVVDGVALPAFRGHLVNSEAPSERARRHDPRRLVWGYHFADEVQRALRARRLEVTGPCTVHTGPWSSHDALVLDYERGLLRTDGDVRYLASTHFPWLGVRTADPEGAHVALLRDTANPVAVKVGPATSPAGLRALCAALDPGREPGRLTLITRMGAEAVTEVLPPLARAVAAHPVVWLSDPMHGNTVRTASGLKTRHLDTLVAEARAVRSVLEGLGQHAGGLHLETAIDEVTECVGGPVRSAEELAAHYTSLCDPRLNREQAAELVDRVY